MIRIAGIVIPDNKHVVISLMSIYGIGKSTAISICNKVDIQHHFKMTQLSEAQIESLRKELTNFVIEGDLRIQIGLSIKRLIDVKCYRGIRHKRGLPVRGQRTKTNAKTIRKLSKVHNKLQTKKQKHLKG